MTDVLFLCIIIILFGFCCYFFIENSNLKKKIIELEEENKRVLEQRIIKNKSMDQVSIQTISDIQESKNLNSVENIQQSEISEIVTEKLSHLEKRGSYDKVKSVDYLEKTQKKVDSKLSSKTQSSSGNSPLLNSYSKVSNNSDGSYQKKVNSRHSNITSPVFITNLECNDKHDSFDMNKLTLDLNEFIKKSEKVVPKIKEKSVHPDYLREISEKMANELKPQTIELTDYEKAQEEHAIISYQELLAIKDRIQIQDDEDENIHFIEDLKQFRNSLN